MTDLDRHLEEADVELHPPEPPTKKLFLNGKEIHRA